MISLLLLSVCLKESGSLHTHIRSVMCVRTDVNTSFPFFVSLPNFFSSCPCSTLLYSQNMMLFCCCCCCRFERSRCNPEKNRPSTNPTARASLFFPNTGWDIQRRRFSLFLLCENASKTRVEKRGETWTTTTTWHPKKIKIRRSHGDMTRVP